MPKAVYILYYININIPNNGAQVYWFEINVKLHYHLLFDQFLKTISNYWFRTSFVTMVAPDNLVDSSMDKADSKGDMSPTTRTVGVRMHYQNKTFNILSANKYTCRGVACSWF